SPIFLLNLIPSPDAFFGDTLTYPVITLPAYFNHPHRQPTKHPPPIPPLQLHPIINHPTPPPLPYPLQKQHQQ
uniref:Hsp70 family protein n=1 Tax=Bacillus thuringiensis TaxID=1428 RepID=UPI0011A21950